MLLYVHRKHRHLLGTEAQDGHLDFHTAPRLALHRIGPVLTIRPYTAFAASPILFIAGACVGTTVVLCTPVVFVLSLCLTSSHAVPPPPLLARPQLAASYRWQGRGRADPVTLSAPSICLPARRKPCTQVERRNVRQFEYTPRISLKSRHFCSNSALSAPYTN